ncbi:UxaA family hydrolase [Anaerovorax sp. IOR16]|uniref:UxaA family hydrolase n=1 Tax=Anaerovorax sp. IOR16 TaxID=2773458 RepID=UPI0019D2A798|nr:altronate dehydratase family protein [Anaerovorax sp. IOR16]
MKAIRIHSKDNVAVALTSLQKGEMVQVAGKNIHLIDEIPQGHKFTLQTIYRNSDIIKYGYPVGELTIDLPEGAWIHTHNLKTKLEETKEYSYHPQISSVDNRNTLYFEGYERKDGTVGIRNEVWIIPTVGCVNSVAQKLANDTVFKDMEGIDGVVAFTHPYGCSQMSDDQENTKEILASLARHPNAGAVLILGLGCENCNIDSIKPFLGDYDKNRIAFLECQGCDDEIQIGKKYLSKLVAYASSFQRTKQPVSKLIVGLKCGGSDGLSGITANPLIGSFSDRWIAMSGSTVLTEIPEMFGAETILLNRCKNTKVFENLLSLIRSYKEYYVRHGQVIYENPSPGNKAGGISTLEEKSLGCIQKGGSTLVCDVCDYGSRIKERGLSILSAPGNDLVSTTALAAAGSQLILFSTGRGTPFGSPVPTVKIATNNQLAEQKSGWIDFNAGELIHGKALNQIASDFIDFVIQIASGKLTKAEKNGYKDFAIFKTGVTL